MSNDLPKPQQSEEVDLGQLFKLIGNAFDRFFRFIGNIFKTLFLAFVWFVFFIKKHIIKLFIAGFIGVLLGFSLETALEPVYKSYATIKQNYQTGENLYNSISYYKDLVRQKDINTLKKSLNIEEAEAASILDFEIVPILTENEKIQNYDTYIKTLDSMVASKVTYETYVANFEDYNYEYQQIAIKAKARNNFKKVFDKIIENIDTNEFFKREQKKDLTELKNQESSLIEALNQSDSLQSTYKRVLEKVSGKENGGQTSITIEGSTQIDKTKEFDLYKSDLELREKLVENRRKQADKEFVIEVVSSKQESGIIDKTKKVFGKTVTNKMFYAVGIVLLTLLVLLSLEFIKFLEKYKTDK
ncbi:hypothetical protein EV196_101678 [Mariniflexile fucanivorans]|uniref:Uncharacterized protein n=1 Tax=Mariniflexile fucanivorans TaxID=264023 RepID=A0A4R1RS15_9FLAO|nr:hypothetical protein [Mariniflexile fucanivorans]TCL69243.1 hypothetical protein EV196_101678 [Mariniflexile fucanivorans]